MTRYLDFLNLANTAYKDFQKIKSTEFVDLGLKGNQAICLFYLGSAENGLTSGELCEKCMEDKAAVSRTLKSLASKGLITISEEEGKKYKLKNVLTDDGRKLYDTIVAKIEKTISSKESKLTKAEKEMFFNCFKTVVTDFDEFCSIFFK